MLKNSILTIGCPQQKMTIECASGRLEARFSSLRWEMDIDLDDPPNVIYSCFVLNNYCELNGNPVLDEVVQKTIQRDRQSQPPTDMSQQSNANKNFEGKAARDVFAECFD